MAQLTETQKYCRKACGKVTRHVARLRKACFRDGNDPTAAEREFLRAIVLLAGTLPDDVDEENEEEGADDGVWAEFKPLARQDRDK